MNSINNAETTGAARSIGAILVDSNRLSVENAEKVIALQKKDLGIRFGDAAVKLGMVTDQDIQYALSCQFDYPYLMASDNSIDSEVIAAFKPFGPTVEQLRVLRSQLMLRWFGTEAIHKSIAVVSPERSEGRSFIAANLAVVFSQLGERTLLVDADLRNPRQHELFKLPNKEGLSSVLAGRCKLGGTLINVPNLRGLTVLTSGAEPPNPQELLNRAEFKSVLDVLRDKFDVVIVDTPSTAEAEAIASQTKGAVVLSSKNKTTVKQVQDFVTSLEQNGVTVVGSILNNIS